MMPRGQMSDPLTIVTKYRTKPEGEDDSLLSYQGKGLEPSLLFDSLSFFLQMTWALRIQPREKESYRSRSVTYLYILIYI